MGDMTESEGLIFAILIEESRARGLFGSDKLIQTRGGFCFVKGVSISLKLTRNKTLTDYGISATVCVQHSG